MRKGLNGEEGGGDVGGLQLHLADFELESVEPLGDDVVALLRVLLLHIGRGRVLTVLQPQLSGAGHLLARVHEERLPHGQQLGQNCGVALLQSFEQRQKV